MRGFAASPIDTVTPIENQRLETRQVGAAKRAFRARLPPIFTRCSFKIGVSLREPQFRARIPSIYISQIAMPATTMRFAENEPHDTFKVLCLPREMTMEVSKVLRLPPKMQLVV